MRLLIVLSFITLLCVAASGFPDDGVTDTEDPEDLQDPQDPQDPEVVPEPIDPYEFFALFVDKHVQFFAILKEQANAVGTVLKDTVEKYKSNVVAHKALTLKTLDDYIKQTATASTPNNVPVRVILYEMFNYIIVRSVEVAFNGMINSFDKLIAQIHTSSNIFGNDLDRTILVIREIFKIPVNQNVGQ